jgi:hypothetical protein
MVTYSLYYVVALWVLLAGSPLLGAYVLAVYGLAQGALLTVDVLFMAAGVDPLGGSWRRNRNSFMFRLSGVALTGTAVFLLAQASLARLTVR